MIRHAIAAFLLAVLLPAFPALAENLSIEYANDTPFELITIRADLATTHGPRKTHSRINLIKGFTYRIGVTGAIKPERIRLDVADGRLDFADLSGLEMAEDMWLTVVYENGRAALRQTNAAGDTLREVEGKAVWLVNDANRPNAVLQKTLVAAKTLDDVRRLVKQAVAAAGGGQKMESFTVEAGPIWSNDHAGERCPQVLAEWNKARKKGAPEARWTGGWSTIREGEMSECAFITGSAGVEGTLFEEEGGEILSFPVSWLGRTVVGFAAPVGDSGIGISMRLTADENALKAAFDDLAKQGYRPLQADLRKRRMDDDEEPRYAKSGKKAAADRADLLGRIVSARADGSLREASCLLVGEAAFKQVAAGKEVSRMPGVMLQVGPETLDAVFLPDCSFYLQ